MSTTYMSPHVRLPQEGRMLVNKNDYYKLLYTLITHGYYHEGLSRIRPKGKEKVGIHWKLKEVSRQYVNNQVVITYDKIITMSWDNLYFHTVSKLKEYKMTDIFLKSYVISKED